MNLFLNVLILIKMISNFLKKFVLKKDRFNYHQIIKFLFHGKILCFYEKIEINGLMWIVFSVVKKVSLYL